MAPQYAQNAGIDFTDGGIGELLLARGLPAYSVLGSG